MARNMFVSLVLLMLASAPAAADVSVDLRGSPASMIRQHEVAQANEYTFLRTPAQVKRFVEKGYLLPVEGNAHYEVLKTVSFPYARPELHTFIERLARQHYEACGEKLVVTSLTRPTADQPRNSHRLSVHPAGMAVDLRVLDSASCRSWLESTLLSLENAELLDVTRERRPPHYHIALFPEAYSAYVAPLIARDSARAEAARLAAERAATEAAILRLAGLETHMVSAARPGERQPVGVGDLATLAAVPLLLGGLAVHVRRKNRGG